MWSLNKNRNWQWLKWAIPGLLILVFGAFAFRTWISAAAAISADRTRTAVVQSGDLIRGINAQGRVVAAVRPMLNSAAARTYSISASSKTVVKPK